uniref:Uncharacterized protein n=1 Tax=Arundo donax TaxID=35708 RepID=A0A0A9E2A6_ARUDO
MAAATIRMTRVKSWHASNTKRNMFFLFLRGYVFAP